MQYLLFFFNPLKKNHADFWNMRRNRRTLGSAIGMLGEKNRSLSMVQYNSKQFRASVIATEFRV